MYFHYARIVTSMTAAGSHTWGKTTPLHFELDPHATDGTANYV